MWDRADHLDAVDLLQLADLLHGEISLAGDEPFRRKALLDDGSLGVDLICDAHAHDQLGEVDAARAKPRIGNGPRREQRLAQRGFSGDLGMGLPCPHARPT